MLRVMLADWSPLELLRSMQHQSCQRSSSRAWLSMPFMTWHPDDDDDDNERTFNSTDTQPF